MLATTFGHMPFVHWPKQHLLSPLATEDGRDEFLHQCLVSVDVMARSGLNVLPVLLLALGAWMSSNCFANSPSPRATSRMAMQGFKDDFYAWKDTLSKEDQALLLKQAQNEFNKKFRATDDFKTSISEDKIESFGKVLQKFFDNEKEDYKKDVEKRTAVTEASPSTHLFLYCSFVEC